MNYQKQEPPVASKHLLVGMKIPIPVLFSMGLYTSDDARSCVNCFDLPAFANYKFQSEKSLTLAISNLPMLKQLHDIKKENMKK